MPPPSIRVERVSARTLQAIFNQSQYPELIASNSIEKITIRSALMGNDEVLRKKKLPIGTKSEIIVYRDKGKNLYVKIHQYLCPDGTLGCSGKPDPKSMLLNGVMYNFHPEAR